jgi:peptidoglycan/xylan/chitin deacetylase (PgdA/CDA1 family)
LILGFAIAGALFFFAMVAFHPVLALAVLFTSHLLMLWPTLAANSSWWGPVVTGFVPNGKELWLTIDDGPQPRDTPALLDLLEEQQARATFFVKGKRAEQYPELIREIVRRGHGLGNHTYSHPSGSFWALPKNRLRAEIDDCSNRLTNITGQRPELFRAVAGMKNFFVHPLLAKRGLQLIGWSARGFDTSTRDVDRVLDRIFRRLKPGGIILLHEDTPIAVECLRRFLGRARIEGYHCVIPEGERFVAKRVIDCVDRRLLLDRTVRRGAGFFLFVMLAVASTKAAPPNEKKLIQVWLERQHDIKSLSADFVQTRSLRSLQSPIRNKGHLWL